MPHNDAFWNHIDRQLDEAALAKTAAALLHALPLAEDYEGEGEGGFDGHSQELHQQLTRHGWTTLYAPTPEVFVVQAPEDRSLVTVIDGTIYAGDHRVAAAY